MVGIVLRALRLCTSYWLLLLHTGERMISTVNGVGRGDTADHRFHTRTPVTKNHGSHDGRDGFMGPGRQGAKLDDFTCDDRQCYDRYHQVLDSISDDCAPRLHDLDAVMHAVADARAVLMAQYPTTKPMPTINESVLGPNDSSMFANDTSGILCVNILFSHGFSPSVRNRHFAEKRLDALRCSLAKLQSHLMVHTKAHVYIWHVSHDAVIPSWLNTKDFPDVHVMKMNGSVWKIPCGMSFDSKWTARDHFDVDYYLMGRWRMTFAMDFAREMGYAYALQLDDDAFIDQLIPFDLVQVFKQKNTRMGFSKELIGTPRHLTTGLPEFVRFWLMIANFNPTGPLYSRFEPPGIEGLSTAGWNMMVHPGYFIVISTDFWYKEIVQNFLTTLFRSGRDIEGFYTEQTIMNFVSMIFVPEQSVFVAGFDVIHDRNDQAYIAECLATYNNTVANVS
jgi:hypothetical protein